MSKRPLTASTPAEPGDRVRLTAEFERTQLLGILFGEFDRNLVAIENRLGVYISARGNRVQIEGEAESAARARDVLVDLYNRIEQGQEVDSGMVDGVIALSAQPTLEGIIRHDASEAPPIMIRTRKKTIVPRAPSQVPYMQALARDDIIFALGPAGTGKTYLAVAQAVAQLITGSVQRLILSRPAVEAGEKLGFLPGDMKEKVDPYLRPLYDALHDCLPAEQVERRIASGGNRDRTARLHARAHARRRLHHPRRSAEHHDPADEDVPDAFRRQQPDGRVRRSETGRSSHPVKLGSRRRRLALQGVEGINVSYFTSADVVRHPIVGRIVDAYEGPGANP
jgi:phosphate starvation-inducible PhoH-like protein